MSRPRKPAPPDPAVIKLPGRVACTDRGQHPEARITPFADEPGEDRKVTCAETPQWDVIADSRPGTLTLRFACRRCGRDVRLREPNVLAVIDVLREAAGGDDRLVFDISLIC